MIAFLRKEHGGAHTLVGTMPNPGEPVSEQSLDLLAMCRRDRAEAERLFQEADRAYHEALNAKDTTARIEASGRWQRLRYAHHDLFLATINRLYGTE